MTTTATGVFSAHGLTKVYEMGEVTVHALRVGRHALHGLSLELQGLFGGAFGSLTRGITERYLQYEAAGLKARSADPTFRHDKSL